MIKKIILFVILSFSTFAFKIDEVKFDKIVPLGKSVTKEFTLENTKDKGVRYMLSIEGNKKNISVTPTKIILQGKEKGKFKVTVKGEPKGKGEYFLVIDEKYLDLNKESTQMKINMKYRIKQKYTVE